MDIKVGAVVIGGLFAAMTACSYGVHEATRATVTATVTDKERIVQTNSEGQASSKYLVFTDKETFENTDSLVELKFNSSDLYGKLKEGQTCRFEVVGFRVAFMSMYRNIVSADCE